MLHNEIDEELEGEESSGTAEEDNDETFAEAVVDSNVTFDGEEIVFHGPHQCLVLASSELYSKKELRQYYEDLRENLESLVEEVEEIITEE